MFILIAAVLACSVGLAAHYLLPLRERRGVVLAPALFTAVSVIVYTVLQWIGLAENNPWLWLASLGGAIAIGFIGTIAISRARIARDEQTARDLGITPR